MRYLVILLAVALSACSGEPDYTYDQLATFTPRCSDQTYQLRRLNQTLRHQGFSKDPDSLDEQDRAFNSKIKAAIWWFEYSCNQN
jgi:hypothetical protein